MAPGATRHRSTPSASTTSSRPRPVSRASTTSINTPLEQSTQSYQHVFQFIHPKPDQPGQTPVAQISPEEMIARSEQQLINPEQSYTDPSMQHQLPQSRAMSVDTSYSGNFDAYRPSLQRFRSQDGKESQSFPTVGENKAQIGAESQDAQRKPKANASSQANDQELRRLFRENRQRDLKEVAGCGTERVPLLNPASFGKLVRIIFPDITTRRLGMRGESKYHYVDLELVTDEPDAEAPIASKTMEDFTGPMTESVRLDQQGQADTAEFPSPDLSLPPPRLGRPSRKVAKGHLYLDASLPDLQQGPSRHNMISRQLKFAEEANDVFLDEAPVELPDIQNYLPAGTDTDTAAALKALYRSHCVSIIDCVRFCKERSFWHSFSSFHGTLTVPCQKLFAHPNLAPWIRECDWLMYQKMINFVSPLALQVMPEVVTNVFQTISDNLGRHVLSTFSSHPKHVQDAKHGPAIIFAGLLSRLLRVNAASHAAAHILGNDATRQQMWHDWVHHVKPTVVAETCLPGVGYSRTVQILTSELRQLLSPLSMTSYSSMQQIYRTVEGDTFGKTSNLQSLDDSSTSSVLDRWVTFLHSLPSRFPNADPRTLLHCVSDVGTAALRDITMATAVSFGQWTVAKVWVDEMLQWLAEKGGFLDTSPSSTEMRPKKRSAEDAGFSIDPGAPISRPRTSTAGAGPGYELDISNQRTQHKAAAPSLTQSHQFHPHEPSYFGFCEHHPTHRGTFPPKPSSAGQEPPSRTHEHQHPRPNSQRNSEQNSREPTKQHEIRSQDCSPQQVGHSILPPSLTKEMQYDDTNDDSGIGLDLDLPQQQTPPRTLADYGGFVTTHTNSDPADVVVC
ncbi:uncharacterized protein KY384_003743 [Bacidia gigantensis]|uniref:uncharacterized protein n=1 Tax=Bacidia gigantensis TaxID=2732470 RepID=UPI001D03B6C7|nr:uncharacterized protein KY384_003743 [Bacidia gigantensis]KAG8532106.1 hypothetical protein KY384_003743 [Bacidia gigantensis]